MVRAGVTASGGTPLLALTVKVNTPGVVGVPDSRPLAASRISPPGSAPEARANVGAGAGGLSAVKAGGARTVMVRAGVTASGGTPLLALTVKVNTPGVVGVPV